jgi:hypothetical protein
VKLNAVVPFIGIVAAPKAFAIAAGEVTLRFADAVLPLPPLLDVTAPVVLVKSPGKIPRTFTLNVQEEFAAKVALE